MIQSLADVIRADWATPLREEAVCGGSYRRPLTNPEAHQHQLSDAQVSEVELAKRELSGNGKIASDGEMDDVCRRFGRLAMRS